MTDAVTDEVAGLLHRAHAAFTIRDGLVERMDVREPMTAAQVASATTR
jgi:hypothetical protein